ncbi:hypothetical protein AS144_07260 [Francisella endosymbiont of Amblyomma maculatum]|nr:hypothetical protein AS144_07260 [Francisella endosymbiont of Amblyomma maculatum]
MNDTLNDVAKYFYANNCYISREQLSKDVKFYVASGLNHVYLSSDNKKLILLSLQNLNIFKTHQK